MTKKDLKRTEVNHNNSKDKRVYFLLSNYMLDNFLRIFLNMLKKFMLVYEDSLHS